MPGYRDEKKSRNDSLRSADMPVFHTPPSRFAVANDLYFSIDVNPDSDNITYRDKSKLVFLNF
jgi:hypothetical protein